MANELRLRVVLDMAARALGPLKQITAGSSGAAKALKVARDRLKELNAQQNAMSGFQKQQAALGETTNKLKVLRQQLDAMRLSESASAAQIATAALTTWKAIRAKFPTSRITVLDGFGGSTGPSAGIIAAVAAISAQFAVWADSNSRLITPVASNYITGTGTADGAITIGNSCQWVGGGGNSDVTHWSIGGAQYIAQRLAADLFAAWGDFV